MDLSFSFFWQQVTSSPAVMITVFLTLCVIFLNGCTDAPNAIATCVSTRSLNVELHRGGHHHQHGEFRGP